MVQSTILGFPRLGPDRELKTALEAFWKGERTEAALLETGASLRALHRKMQKDAGIDLLPSGDFTFYDHMLDMAALLGVVPLRYGWSEARSIWRLISRWREARNKAVWTFPPPR
jgi:5-methyltetrahydropteroyltriglutamate--homocysteine methyltransferase